MDAPSQVSPQSNPNPAPATPPVNPPAPGNNNGMAILAYLGILIVVPFLTEAKNDPFVKFHLKQGLALIISELIAMVVVAVPILGWMAAPIIWLFNVVMIILGIINAASGKEKELPIIGGIAKNFNF